jgi:hypothetical protein
MSFFNEVIDSSWLSDVRPAEIPPPWITPPYDVVPAHFDTLVDLTRARDLAIWLSGAHVYPAGVSLELHVRWNGSRSIPLPLGPIDRGRAGLCLGAEFDDGCRLLCMPQRRQVRQSPPARAITITPLHARPSLAISQIWIWPFPCTAFSWVLEWRSQGIRETRARFDPTPLELAASGARPVWPRAPGGEHAIPRGGDSAVAHSVGDAAVAPSRVP